MRRPTIAGNQRIELGTDVYSRDGEKVGSVDRLVLNSENNHVEQLVVNQGFFSTDKLIDLDLVAQVNPDRIVLNMAKAQAEQLPDFVETQYAAAPTDAYAGAGMGAVPYAGGIGLGRLYYGGPLLGSTYADPVPGGYGVGGTSPVVENVSNIPEHDVMIGEGTDVVGADGEKVGSVHQVMYGADGAIEGFVVKEGFIFKKDVTIPMGWVSEVGGNAVHLNVTAAQAERGA